MNGRRCIPAVLILVSALLSCSYRVPYLSLNLKTEYSVSDITVYYSYVCEKDSQRCIYSLYNKNNPSQILYSDDRIMPETGSLIFNDLEEGEYRLSFAVFSERNGIYYPLKFLDISRDFTVDLLP